MHTERGFDRLVNFSDAVVAIAITLLILPLVDTATEFTGDNILDLLQEDWLKLLVFVISFVVIGRFWLAHHRMYESINGYNSGLLWVNLLWLMSIVFLPFPTELIATSGGDNPTTSLLYVGTMVVTSMSGAWQQWIVIRHPELQAPEARGTIRIGPAISTAAMMVVVFIATALLPQLGLLTLLLLLLAGPLQAITRRLARRSDAGTAAP
ncbi:TMEM175 family protein [Herbiconiux sp.]|uniref:TMEM175 family protein n=1 Tax=Herbiconiux sp. TaxID=1871186 RepID=UPI0025BCF5E8|nr:TMEM175 family protein [Herbiconiux sp.]